MWKNERSHCAAEVLCSCVNASTPHFAEGFVCLCKFWLKWEVVSRLLLGVGYVFWIIERVSVVDRVKESDCLVAA